jgi:hypothetical protein
MVKLFSTSHTFHHPFDRVTSAFWRKYPNEAAAHVKAIDITDRRVDAQGRLITNRVMSCESALPQWLRAAGLPQSCFVAESSIVDPQAQTMVVKSVNLSGASIMTVEETCTYQAQPSTENAKPSTLYQQEARITAFLPFVSSKFESYSVASITAKSQEGIAVMEKLSQRIQREGVLSLLPTWEGVFGAKEGGGAAQ